MLQLVAVILQNEILGLPNRLRRLLQLAGEEEFILLMQKSGSEFSPASKDGSLTNPNVLIEPAFISKPHHTYILTLV